MEKNIQFSKKTILIFKVMSYACVFSVVCACAFYFEGIRNLLIDFGEKLKGRPLNRQNWHEVILKRTFVWIVISLVLAVAFRLLCYVKFFEAKGIKAVRIHIFNGTDFFKQKKTFLAILLLVFAYCSFLRFYWGSQKKGFHPDEYSEYSIINRTEHGFYHTTDFEHKKPFTGKEIKTEAYFDNASIKDFVSDMVHLYVHCDDNPHTGVYYMIQRIPFLGVKTSDEGAILWRNLLLNFVLFVLEFYFATLIVQKITKNSFISLLLLLAAFANPMTLGNFWFFRPFFLQELAMILFAYIFVCFYQALERGLVFETKRNFVIATVCLGFALCSEYFTLFFVALLGLFIIIKCIRQKRVDAILFFVAMFFAGFIVAKLLYLDFGIGYFDERRPSSDKVGKFINGFTESVNYINRSFLHTAIFIALILCNVALFFVCRRFYKKSGKETTVSFIPLVLLFSSIVWILLCNYFAPPYKTPRYCAAAFVFLPLVLLPLFSLQNRATRIAVYFAQVVLTILIILHSVPLHKNKEWQWNLEQRHGQWNTMQYTKDASIPVVIESPLIEWAMYPYLNDEQVYYFVSSKDEANTLGLKKYWYITNSNPGYVLHEELVAVP